LTSETDIKSIKKAEKQNMRDERRKMSSKPTLPPVELTACSVIDSAPDKELLSCSQKMDQEMSSFF
jgi:hypothetical protein